MRQEIANLEKEHGLRRSWVWAKLGKCPLAMALEHLLDLSILSSQPFAGASVEDIALRYSQEGWKVDSAALYAMACVYETKHLEAVSSVLDVLYRPWLTDCCEASQAAWMSSPPSGRKLNRKPEKGVAYVFTDGLRMDLAQILAKKLFEDGLEVNINYEYAALPSATETGKPAASPVVEEISGGPELSLVTKEGRKVDAEVLRILLQKHGFAVLGPDETGNPEEPAWTECGRLDEIGHVEGWRIAHRLEEQLMHVKNRVTELLEAGWYEVRVITDHGWLLLPGGLPTYNLPEVATLARKGRYAYLKPEASVDCQTEPWFWDASIQIAVAPGIKCFVAGRDYDHGGISPQEIVVPEIRVRMCKAKPAITFKDVKWFGLRCKIILAGAFEGLSADLRTKPGDSNSSVAEAPKEIGKDGAVSLVCPNESLEGTAAVVVIYASEKPERVLEQFPTVIGGSNE